MTIAKGVLGAAKNTLAPPTPAVPAAPTPPVGPTATVGAKGLLTPIVKPLTRPKGLSAPVAKSAFGVEHGPTSWYR